MPFLLAASAQIQCCPYHGAVPTTESPAAPTPAARAASRGRAAHPGRLPTRKQTRRDGTAMSEPRAGGERKFTVR